MAYNEKTSKRISNALMKKGIEFEEKKMFGGIAFMIKGKMSVGVMKDDLTVRVIEEKYEKALSDQAAREMDFTGRPLKGFLYVNESGFKTEKALSKWIDLGIDFVNCLKINKKKK
ncbi:MAG TPA: TfoX/Sxy family protein [Ignavibacteria bacterium]|nr:TfoX/Sxy family protein [Ignavibacteria bacterium]